MPVVKTNHFGVMEYEAESALEFPRGLPGFEQCRGFLPLHQPENDPLIFLQSLEDPGLCFVTVPVRVIDPEYRLDVEPDDLAAIGLAGKVELGGQVLCLAVLSIREDGPTANLLAPIVVNMATGKSVQAVAPGSAYSHRHPLCAEEAMACS
jgi:flagellar assembly factor FliW